MMSWKKAVRTMRGRIERIAYIGWRGIDYEAITLDKEAFTGLIGPSGAGKSTLVMCLDYALLPDRKVLDIRPISDVQDPHQAGMDTLLARINPAYGYAYVVLDVQTRHGQRLLAGIHARGENGRGELTRFYIDNYPIDAPLQEAFRVLDGDGQYYPDLQDLSRHLAGHGFDLHICRTVAEYGQVLYDAGVLPTNLADSSDRSLYSRLIETTFRGGISADVATKLKDYLLPEERRVPELVSKLRECTSQVFSTRRALGDANRQLDLLQATYGTGKEIVAHALRHELDKHGELERTVDTLRNGIGSDTQDLEYHQADLERISKEIGVLEETIRNLQSNVQTELKNEEVLKDSRGRDQASSNTALENAKGLFNQFKKGEKAWRVAARNHADHDQRWLEQWFDREIEKLNEATMRVRLQIEGLQGEKNTLEVGSSNQKTATLAKAVGGQTLEEALDSVTEREALALNMGLCGLADGVTGVTPDVLVHLEANKDLPDIFWLGETPPGPATVRSVGEWHVATGAGGYIVSSKARHPVFGRQARLDRIGRIDTEIDKLLKKQEEARLEKEGEDGQGGLKGRQKLLQINSEAIAFFIQNRADALSIELEVATAKAKHEEVVRLYLESDTKVTDLRKKLLEAAGSHQGAHEDLKIKKTQASNKIADLNSRLPGAQQNLLEAQKNLTELNEGLASILEHLGLQAETFLADASTLEAEMSEIYVVKQTKRLMQLGDTLKDELPDRLRLIHEASATDTASCIHLWPMLLEVLRDRVVLDLADMDGTDLLGAMRTRRNDLDQKLGLQENEVKIQARSINSAIRSAVTSQRNRIKALSRMGENIHFGNVVGIRIAVQTHQDMLGMLESFADQMTLFAEDTKPVDEALHEFFDKAGDKYKFTGEELLDYRTYMDLVIEAKRQGGEWQTASSLSGGESIGGGLAIALMLSRALASRGEIKPDQITPLFAIDEVHRLDPKGQGMIVEFAKRENFQVFVTASSLKPSYACTLYALERIYEPEERLVIRGMEKVSKAVA